MTVPDRLYLDHAATAPVLAPVRDAMARAVETWANPSSPHAEGRAARAALEDARHRIAAALGWSHEIIFTSGASEAISIALTRTAADVTLLSAIEHDAVQRCAPHGFLIPVAPDGRVTPDRVYGRLSALSAARPLVAVQRIMKQG